jgi:NAD(P)-dependent dehydrogenase (short-subunit alcohol dehydrogenase family)
MIAMTVDMAYSHGRQGIRVNAVAPGHITTPMVLSVTAPGPRAEFMNTMRNEAGLLGTPGDGPPSSPATRRGGSPASPCRSIPAC